MILDTIRYNHDILPYFMSAILHKFKVPSYRFKEQLDWTIYQFDKDNKLSLDDLILIGERHKELYSTPQWDSLGVLYLEKAGFVIAQGGGVKHSKLAEVCVNNKIAPQWYMYDIIAHNCSIYQSTQKLNLINRIQAPDAVYEALYKSIASDAREI